MFDMFIPRLTTLFMFDMSMPRSFAPSAFGISMLASFISFTSGILMLTLSTLFASCLFFSRLYLPRLSPLISILLFLQTSIFILRKQRLNQLNQIIKKLFLKEAPLIFAFLLSQI